MKKLIALIVLSAAAFAQGPGAGDAVKRWDPQTRTWVDAFPSGNAVEINSIPVSSTAPTNGQVLQFNGTAWIPATPNQSVTLAGDVDGTVGATKVVSIQGFPVAAATPAAGQVLVFNGLAGQYEPRLIEVESNPSLSGDLSGTASAASVVALRGFSIAAATPQNGHVLQFNGSAWAPTSAPSGNPALGGDLNGTASSATVTKLQGVSVSTASPASGQYMVFNGTSWAPAPEPTFSPSYSGDVTGSPSAMVVGKIQGVAVHSGTPADGYLLAYNAIGQEWRAKAPPTVITQTSQLTNNSGFLTAVPAQAWTSITGKPTFATVATSGSYADLSNKPTIPTQTSQLTNNSSFMAAPSGATNQLLAYNGSAWAAADDIRQLSYVISDSSADLTATTGTVATVFSNRSGKSWTVQEVYCQSDSGSPTFNLLIGGSNLFASAQTCTTSGGAFTSFSAPAVATGTNVSHTLVAGATGNKRMSLSVKYRQ